MVSTDALYFAVGKYDLDGGVMITASHNPAQYNGMKFTRVAGPGDLPRYRAWPRFATGCSRAICRRRPRPRAASRSATFSTTSPSTASRSSTARRSSRCGSPSTPVTAWPARRSRTFSRAFPASSCRSTSSSTAAFRITRPVPIEPENMVDLQAAVRKHSCDLGVAFDGDADRMFFVDEKGEPDRRQHGDRAGRAQHAQEESRREDPLQLDLQPQRSRTDPQGRRRSGSLEGRPLDHQGRDARTRTSFLAASTAVTSTFATTGTRIRA